LPNDELNGRDCCSSSSSSSSSRIGIASDLESVFCIKK